MRWLISTCCFLMTSAPAIAGSDEHSVQTEFQLPSTAELEAAIDDLPDLNAILADLLYLVEDEKIQKRIERSGDAFTEKLERSGALEPDENGLPDIKQTLKVIVSAVGDEEVAGGLLETVMELQAVLDKHLPKDDSDIGPH